MLLPSPLKEGDSVPPRPPLPQYYDSSERPPHVLPHHSHPSGRLPPHTHRPEDRKAGSRNGAHSVRTAETFMPPFHSISAPSIHHCARHPLAHWTSASERIIPKPIFTFIFIVFTPQLHTLMNCTEVTYSSRSATLDQCKSFQNCVFFFVFFLPL